MSTLSHKVRRAAVAMSLGSLAFGAIGTAAESAGASPLPVASHTATFNVPSRIQPWLIWFQGSFPTTDLTSSRAYDSSAYSLRTTCSDGRSWTAPAHVTPNGSKSYAIWVIQSSDVSAGVRLGDEAGNVCTVAPNFPVNRTVGLQASSGWNDALIGPDRVPGVALSYDADVSVLASSAPGGSY